MGEVMDTVMGDIDFRLRFLALFFRLLFELFWLGVEVFEDEEEEELGGPDVTFFVSISDESIFAEPGQRQSRPRDEEQASNRVRPVGLS